MKTEDEIRKIALDDAGRAYRDLTLYTVQMEKVEAIWKVAFVLKDPNLDGGGPYYEIDAESGEIITRIYYQ
jgi:hypothetical protein